MNPVFLTQTDTTAGLLSRDCEKLNIIKNRNKNQKLLLCLSDFKELKKQFRIPNSHKNFVRRAKKTSFIVKDESFRVVLDSAHNKFIKHFGYIYSTSANKHKEHFNLDWAIESSDIIVLDSRGINENLASKIYKLGNNKKIRLR